MSLVAQEPVLFSRSIYENIIYGVKDLTKEKVIQASKDANAYDFIEGLSKKYETDAGEFGTQLSGKIQETQFIRRQFRKLESCPPPNTLGITIIP